MKIRILIDNQPDRERNLYAEHGLSILVETDTRKRILLDTGLSGHFIDNAKHMGIDLNNVDFCFLSHGHNDHSGGLQRFLENYPGKKTYLSERIFHEHYFTSRHGGKKNISTDTELLQRYASNLYSIPKSQWLIPDIAAVYCNHNEYPIPSGNVFLSKEISGVTYSDEFSHEMSMAIKTNRGLIVFSSCSHGGAVNIMKSSQDFTACQKIQAYIGGLHFVDGEQTEQEVNTFVKNMQSSFPHVKIFTGHCTSDKAKKLLKDSGLQLSFFHTGKEFII